MQVIEKSSLLDILEISGYSFLKTIKSVAMRKTWMRKTWMRKTKYDKKTALNSINQSKP